MAVDTALSILHAAADGETPDAPDVFQAIRSISKAKLPVDFGTIITGEADTMRRWQLLYTVSGADINAANAGQPTRGGGYWPIAILPACLGYAGDGAHENGVYLASGALSIKFQGLYDLQSVR